MPERVLLEDDLLQLESFGSSSRPSAPIPKPRRFVDLSVDDNGRSYLVPLHKVLTTEGLITTIKRLLRNQLSKGDDVEACLVEGWWTIEFGPDRLVDLDDWEEVVENGGKYHINTNAMGGPTFNEYGYTGAGTHAQTVMQELSTPRAPVVEKPIVALPPSIMKIKTKKPTFGDFNIESLKTSPEKRAFLSQQRQHQEKLQAAESLRNQTSLERYWRDSSATVATISSESSPSKMAFLPFMVNQATASLSPALGPTTPDFVPTTEPTTCDWISPSEAQPIATEFIPAAKPAHPALSFKAPEFVPAVESTSPTLFFQTNPQPAEPVVISAVRSKPTVADWVDEREQVAEIRPTVPNLMDRAEPAAEFKPIETNGVDESLSTAEPKLNGTDWPEESLPASKIIPSATSWADEPIPANKTAPAVTDWTDEPLPAVKLTLPETSLADGPLPAATLMSAVTKWTSEMGLVAQFDPAIANSAAEAEAKVRQITTTTSVWAPTSNSWDKWSAAESLQNLPPDNSWGTAITPETKLDTNWDEVDPSSAAKNGWGDITAQPIMPNGFTSVRKVRPVDNNWVQPAPPSNRWVPPAGPAITPTIQAVTSTVPAVAPIAPFMTLTVPVVHPFGPGVTPTSPAVRPIGPVVRPNGSLVPPTGPAAERNGNGLTLNLRSLIHSPPTFSPSELRRATNGRTSQSSVTTSVAGSARGSVSTMHLRFVVLLTHTLPIPCQWPLTEKKIKTIILSFNPTTEVAKAIEAIRGKGKSEKYAGPLAALKVLTVERGMLVGGEVHRMKGFETNSFGDIGFDGKGGKKDYICMLAE